MSKYTRFALALPLCAVMSAPAHADLFWDFTISWGDVNSPNATLSGVTPTTTDPFGDSFALGSLPTAELSFTDNVLGLSGTPVWYDGTVASGTTFLGLPTFTTVSSTTQTLDFTGTLNTPPGGTPADDASFSGGFLFTLDTAPSERFWFLGPLAGGGTELRTGTQRTSLFNPGSPDVRGGDTDSRGTSFSVDATLVPEINGSGFAYIAFVLGSIGLWLYSGAGRVRREEDMPTAA